MTPTPIKKRLAQGSVLTILATTFIGGEEGLRINAYPDPATRGKPWTDCYGHTAGVRPGMRESLTQCKELLRQDLGKDADALDKCVTYPTTNGQAIAFLSLAYNIGTGGFCRSSVARDFNAGRTQKACDDLLHFDRAAGITFPGLTHRRQAERRLCLGD
jgi:lysozyme